MVYQELGPQTKCSHVDMHGRYKSNPNISSVDLVASTKKQYSIRKLNEIPRATFAGVVGAIKSWPTHERTKHTHKQLT